MGVESADVDFFADKTPVGSPIHSILTYMLAFIRAW